MNQESLSILLVTRRGPWVNSRGGGRRSFFLWKALKSFAEVDIAYIAADGIVPKQNNFQIVHTYVRKLEKTSVTKKILSKIWQYPFVLRDVFHQDKEFWGWLKKQNYDLIVCHNLQSATACGAFDFPPVVIDLDDLFTQSHLKLIQQSSVIPDIFLKLASKIKWFFNDRVASLLTNSHLARTDFVWVAKEQDKIHVPHRNCSVLPNIAAVDTEDTKRDYHPTKKILFIGAYSHLQNREGLEHFLKNIWPGVLAKDSKVTLSVVGIDWENRSDDWQSHSNVEYVGYVEDLAKVYRKVDYSIAPIFSGSGTLCKVIESCAFGVPCVASPHAVKGIEILVDKDAVLVAKDDNEFIQCCLRLSNKQELREEMGQNARSASEDEFSYEKFRSVVQRTVNKICG